MIDKSYILLILNFFSSFYIRLNFALISNDFKNTQEPHLFLERSDSKRFISGFIQKTDDDENSNHHNESNLVSRTWFNETLVNFVNLKDNHEQLTVHWAGKYSPVIICLAKNRSNTKQNQSSSVYISHNYGHTFEKVTVFKQTDGSPSVIHTFYISPILNSYYLFVDQKNKYIFITKDFGKNFQRINLDFTPKTFQLHHTIPDLILAQSLETDQSNSSLYLSQNFGLSWKKIQDKVGFFSWSTPNIHLDMKTIFLQRFEPNGLSTLLSSSDFFFKSPIKTWLTHVEKVEIHKRFIFATRRFHLLGTRRNTPSHQMWISVDGEPFFRAMFFAPQEAINYHVADVTDNTIFLCVTFNNSQTNLYTSTNEFNAFILSLENIVFFNPDVSNHLPGINYEISKDKEFADLHRVAKIRGTYIISKWKNKERKSISDIITLITFDVGNRWHTLKPPMIDAFGHPIICNITQDGCSLHLTQRYLSMNSNLKPILSRDSSVGFIMATGVLGNSLKGKQNIYLSIDAGNTWRQILSGSYLYAFGDFGGVIVAVEHYSKSGPTNELYYSIDDGYSFSLLKFHPEKIRVYGLLTEPEEKSTVFTIFGSKEKSHEWIIIQVNLTKVFDSKCRIPQDYNEWSPHDFESKCLLGSTQIFLRRIPGLKCFNGKEFLRPVLQINCPCKHSDYECDFGYSPVSKTIGFRCIPDRLTSSLFESLTMTLSCKPGHMFNKTKGYRKINGDTCEGGDEEWYSPHVIPCPFDNEVVPEFILFVQRQEISMIPLNDENFTEYPLLPKSFLSNAIAADFDIRNNCLYWSDIHLNKILRYCFDGQQLQPEVLVEIGLDSVEGIAYNQINGHLYFANGNKSKVELINIRINYEGRMRRTILTQPNIKKPRGIAIDPIDCYLFITDWSFTSAIIRSDLDGKNVQVLFNSNTVTWPNGITVDHRIKRIFWVDAKHDYIASSQYDGTDLKYLLRGEQTPHPFALGVFKDLVFYGDRILHKLILFSKNNAAIQKVILEDVTSAMDLKIVSNQFLNHTNVCNQNLTCSHLCIAKPFNSYRCLCPDGFIITQTPDGNERCSCPENQELTETGACRALSSNMSCLTHEFQCDNGNCVSRYLKCNDDDDCKDGSDEKYCYDSQCKLREFRCKTSGKCIQDLLICDYEKQCEDGSDEDITLCASIYPKCDPTYEFQCNNYRCIDKRNVCDFIDHCRDGSDEVACFYNHSTTENITKCGDNHFRCENGYCIQKFGRCDGHFDCSDQSDENNCQSECSENEFRCPHNICIDKLFICDFDKDCIDGSDEANCNYDDLTANNNNTDNSWNHFNHSCPTKEWFQCNSKECIPSEWYCDGRKDCPDSSDEINCPEKPILNNSIVTNNNTKENQGCGENKFFCYKSNHCIFRLFVCDGSYDCREREDELNCFNDSTAKCPMNYFPCILSLGCLPARRICDGQRDCFDGSDEWGCLNSKVPIQPICLGFSCKDGDCIEYSQRCDSEADCLDGSDEEDCQEMSHRVNAIFVQYDSIRSDSFTIYWMHSEKNHSYLYMPAYSILDVRFDNYSFNASWTSNETYTFNNLHPGLTYKVFVYSKLNDSNDTRIYPSESFIKVTTESIKPNPPENLSAQVVDYNRVLLKWSTSKWLDEPIKSYKVYQRPPDPAIFIDCHENQIQLCCFQSNINFTFWVTSLTKNLESDSSKKISILIKPVGTIQDLIQKNVTDTSVTLAWKAQSESIQKWLIVYTCEDYFPAFSKNLSVENTQATIENLSPGVNYQFKLYPYIGDVVRFEGIENVISVQTLGFQLPSVSVEFLVIGSRISLWWSSAPKYLNMSEIEWEYAIYVSDSNIASDLRLHAQTKYRKIILKNLLSCQLYMVQVRVIKPYGIGPADNPLSIMTEFDPTSPPKNINYKVSNAERTQYKISWNNSCPGPIKEKVGYIVSVYDLTNKYLDRFRFQPTFDIYHSFDLNIHYGAIYEIKISTTSHDSRWSKKIILVPPPMPMVAKPFAYIDHNERINIIWKTIDNYPKDQQHILQYKVYVHNEKDIKKGQFVQTKGPPAVIEPKVKSDLYYIAISLIDNHGYSGPLSEIYYLYTNDLPLGSSSSYLFILGTKEIFLIIVMIFSTVLLSYMAFKKFYRQTSPISFIVSSYYNSRSESATLSYDNLQDEDGHFYSDEPLVLA